MHWEPSGDLIVYSNVSVSDSWMLEWGSSREDEHPPALCITGQHQPAQRGRTLARTCTRLGFTLPSQRRGFSHFSLCVTSWGGCFKRPRGSSSSREVVQSSNVSDFLFLTSCFWEGQNPSQLGVLTFTEEGCNLNVHRIRTIIHQRQQIHYGH